MKFSHKLLLLLLSLQLSLVGIVMPNLSEGRVRIQTEWVFSKFSPSGFRVYVRTHGIPSRVSDLFSPAYAAFIQEQTHDFDVKCSTREMQNQSFSLLNIFSRFRYFARSLPGDFA